MRCSPSVGWSVVDVDADRQSDLKLHFDFEVLADSVAAEADAIVFQKERGTHEAKGSWRPTFVLELSRQLFDRFFNNPCGYRGHYLAGPELGTSANLRLLKIIAPRLLAAVPESTTDQQAVRDSLASPAAKVWMDENQHNPRTPELLVQVLVPTWVAAAQAVHERLRTADPTLTPKEVDRIFGVRAPSATRLKVFGAWVGSKGVEPVVPSKQRRAQEIHDFGVS